MIKYEDYLKLKPFIIGNKQSIVKEGQGNFLDPPMYPQYFFHVAVIRGSLSLEYALKVDYIEEEIKNKIKILIDFWNRNRLPLWDKDIKNWIYRSLDYFNNCYKGINKTWKVNDLIIKDYRYEQRFDKNNKEIKVKINDDEYYKKLITIQNHHAGVHHIRKFYPEYKAIAEDFKKAYWGKKPE